MMTKLQRQKKRALMILSLLGCLGWLILGLVVRESNWGLGSFLMLLAGGCAALAVESEWRWLV